MNIQEINSLIDRAKAGDPVSKNKLVKCMQDNGYMRSLGKYLHKNRLLEPQDVQSEFWVGVILALPKVSTQIGDPLHYLAWRGINRVKDILKRRIKRGVTIHCLDCDYIGQPHKDTENADKKHPKKNRVYKCFDCGSTNYETAEISINTSAILTGKEDIEEPNDKISLIIATPPTQLIIDTKLDFEYMKTLLAPREAEVLTLIIEQEIDKEHEQNYLTRIGEIMGISNQCVVQYIKRARKKLLAIKDEIC